MFPHNNEKTLFDRRFSTPMGVTASYSNDEMSREQSASSYPVSSNKKNAKKAFRQIR